MALPHHMVGMATGPETSLQGGASLLGVVVLSGNASDSLTEASLAVLSRATGQSKPPHLIGGEDSGSRGTLDKLKLNLNQKGRETERRRGREGGMKENRGRETERQRDER